MSPKPEQLTAHQDGKLPKNGLQFYKTLSDDYPVVHFSYEIKFSEGFDWQLGGKMPGLDGKPADAPDSYNPTGGNPVGPDDGFSAQGSFREDGTANGYIYHQDNPDQYGEYVDFSVMGHDVPLPTGRTLFIEQTVQMNTPGESDGVIQTWPGGAEYSGERLQTARSKHSIHDKNLRLILPRH